MHFHLFQNYKDRVKIKYEFRSISLHFFVRTNFIRTTRLKLVKNTNKFRTFWGWEMYRQKNKNDELFFFQTRYKRMIWMPSKSSIVRWSDVLSGYATFYSLRTVLKYVISPLNHPFLYKAFTFFPTRASVKSGSCMLSSRISSSLFKIIFYDICFILLIHWINRVWDRRCLHRFDRH